MDVIAALRKSALDKFELGEQEAIIVSVGDDLSTPRLLSAYRSGIFPWYLEGEPVLWRTTSPRTVLFPNEIHLSRSLVKTLRHKSYRVTFNHAFTEVIRHCARVPRKGQMGITWITPAIQRAYRRLHALGKAHSFEYWQTDASTSCEELLGGLYGVCIGSVFYGESMFSLADDASKITFVHAARFLSEHGIRLVDCQQRTTHMVRFGAFDVPLSDFQAALRVLCEAQNTLPEHAVLV